jgi:Mg-chelatase subunit ChlD
LFGQETSVAMWLFGTPAPTSPPYRVVVPFGPLDEAVGGAPRRDVVAAAAGRYAAFPQAGTPLYETVLRGVDDMRARARPDAVTIVVVLTDGRDQDTRYAMSREEFLARLAQGRDASRPVPVFGIGYGAAADLGALTGMAAVTGGQTVSSNDPGDLASAVAKIFLAAHRAHG